MCIRDRAERGQAARTGKLTEIGKWGMREWYVVTYLFGATFIAGQVLEYAKLVSENVTLSSDRYGSVFYMATGFHGLHAVSYTHLDVYKRQGHGQRGPGVEDHRVSHGSRRPGEHVTHHLRVVCRVPASQRLGRSQRQT